MTAQPFLDRAAIAAERQFPVTLSMCIRLARAEDLPLLEWFGWFTAHREIIRGAYDAQLAGTGLMLVAISADFPVAQTWIDLARKQDEGVGMLWAIRVLPGLQRAGIGRRLISEAERQLRERGYAFAELGVEHHNVDAHRLYRRLGYLEHGRSHQIVEFTTPSSARSTLEIDELLLRKRLDRTPLTSPATRRFQA